MIRTDQHLVLVGMMGVGKSTAARVLADRLGRRVIDSDAVIEARTGRTVREIFAEDGEAAFRALETDVLLEALASEEPLVIAAAGVALIWRQFSEADRQRRLPGPFRGGVGVALLLGQMGRAVVQPRQLDIQLSQFQQRKLLE